MRPVLHAESAMGLGPVARDLAERDLALDVRPRSPGIDRDPAPSTAGRASSRHSRRRFPETRIGRARPGLPPMTL